MGCELRRVAVWVVVVVALVVVVAVAVVVVEVVVMGVRGQRVVKLWW